MINSKSARSRSPAAQGKAPSRGRRADDRKTARRDAILAAALDEFAARGFAGARLDDVARRAGVAKGTIYLYFRDKEALFQDLIRSTLAPVVGALESGAGADLPARIIADRFIDVFVRDVVGTRRKDVIRLIISEGPRFPKLAEFYYREVLTRVLNAIRALMTRAVERGEVGNDALVRFPQLLGAPAILAILWGALFERFEPLDIRAFMRAYLDIVFGDGEAK